ncbi:MAG: hypothetical protein WBR18_12945 [Anaerolineales bacterium]
MSNDVVGFAVAALRAEGAIHYDSPCPRCRTKNRVSLEQLEEEVKSKRIDVPELPADEQAEGTD